MGWPTMRWACWVSLTLALAACEEPPETTETGDTADTDVKFVPPCGAEGDPVIELSMAGEAHGSFADGDDLWCGNPPQGGAPYSPLTLRMRHLSDVRDGTTATMIAKDMDTGELLGETELYMGFACANVGDNTDWWVGGGEAHLRYTGFELDELYGRDIELQVSVVNNDGDEAFIIMQSHLIPRE